MNNTIYMKWIIIFFVGILSISCNNEKNKFEKCVKDVLADISLSDIDYIVIIPSQGCGGCITYAEDFCKRNQSKNGIFFVFTNIVSLKILKQKIDFHNKNIYFDQTNEFLLAYPPDKKLYPAILKVNAGEVIDVYYQSPDENGFSKILI